jgi:hypothetical protein
LQIETPEAVFTWRTEQQLISQYGVDYLGGRELINNYPEGVTEKQEIYTDVIPVPEVNYCYYTFTLKEEVSEIDSLYNLQEFDITGVSLFDPINAYSTQYGQYAWSKMSGVYKIPGANFVCHFRLFEQLGTPEQPLTYLEGIGNYVIGTTDQIGYNIYTQFEVA